jgi:hypothetical protein
MWAELSSKARDIDGLSVPTPAELKAAHCWEPSDQIPKQPAATAFRRRLRLRQARWREAHGHPIGRLPIRGHSNSRMLGSRLDFEHAVRTGANFLTPGALQAARARVSAPERFEMLNRDRLWADLLSSMPMCFNLFGDLQQSLSAADRAIKAWPLDAPGKIESVRFEWSPGRRDPSYLGNQSAFDVAFLLEPKGPSGRGVVGIETKYHEAALPESAPFPKQLRRYVNVMNEVGMHVPQAEEEIVGTSNIGSPGRFGHS